MATQILQNHAGVLSRGDAEDLASIEGEMMDNILTKFYDAELDLTAEELDHDFKALPGTRLYYLGHANCCLQKQ